MNKIQSQIKKIKRLAENRISDIKELKNQIIKILEYPSENYEIVNKPVKKEDIGKNIGVVLSGGGARGAAHLGVLKSFEEKNIKPAFVVGTSAGAIIGAVYLSGIKIEEALKIYEEEEKNFKELSLVKNLSPKKRTEFLKNILKKYLPVKTFEGLTANLYVNATDIKSCERVIISKGNLIDAIMASSAIPFVFQPIDYKNRILVDGGVMDFFAIDIARKINRTRFSGKFKIIISDVSGMTDKTTPLIKIQNALVNLSKEFMEIAKLMGNEKWEVKDKNDIISIINNLFYILRNRHSLFPSIKRDEYIVTPYLEKMSMFNFAKYRFAYEKGLLAGREIIK